MESEAALRGVLPKKHVRRNFGVTDGPRIIIERSQVANTDARPDVKTARRPGPRNDLYKHGILAIARWDYLVQVAVVQHEIVFTIHITPACGNKPWTSKVYPVSNPASFVETAMELLSRISLQVRANKPMPAVFS